MDTRRLGRTGVEVSPLCLGAMMFGAWGNRDHDESVEIVEAQWVAERRGRERFVCEQPPYSMLVRGIEVDVLPTCARYGMGVITWGGRRPCLLYTSPSPRDRQKSRM